MARSLDTQRSMNIEQITQRIKMGDHLSVPREVEHFALFGGRKEADAARARLEAAGFAAHVSRKGWSKFEVRATHLTSIEAPEVDNFVEQVFGIVEAAHGSYDGWGGPLA